MPETLLEFAPYKNPMVTEQRFITGPWQEWFELALIQRVQSSAPVVNTPINLTNQSASIGLTAILAAPDAGVYRVTVFARVVQAATTSSGLQVDITATDGAVPYTQSSANVTGNTTTTILAQSFIVRTDAAAPIDYTVTYASAGGTPMLYDLRIVLEQVT